MSTECIAYVQVCREEYPGIPFHTRLPLLVCIHSPIHGMAVAAPTHLSWGFKNVKREPSHGMDF